MSKTYGEVIVGLFLIIGFLAFGWLALQLGEVDWLTGSKTYLLNAQFDDISGVKEGADVQVAGVVVGRVEKIWLSEDDLATVSIRIDRKLRVPVDSMASVKSQGIIGDKYIQLTLGGDEEYMKPGETIVDTESSVNIESLISKFAFGKVE